MSKYAQTTLRIAGVLAFTYGLFLACVISHSNLTFAIASKNYHASIASPLDYFYDLFLCAAGVLLSGIGLPGRIRKML
jgi:hypothetical protein